MLTRHVVLSQMLNITSHHVCRIVQCDKALLFVADHVRNKLWSIDARGDRFTAPLDTGVLGFTAKSATACHIPDCANDPRFSRQIDEHIDDYTTRNVLCSPSLVHGRLIGVLHVTNKLTAQHFTSIDEVMVSMVAGFVGSLVHNASELQEVRREVGMQTAILSVQPSISSSIIKSLEAPFDKLRVVKLLQEQARNIFNALECRVFILEVPYKPKRPALLTRHGQKPDERPKLFKQTVEEPADVDAALSLLDKVTEKRMAQDSAENYREVKHPGRMWHLGETVSLECVSTPIPVWHNAAAGLAGAAVVDGYLTVHSFATPAMEPSFNYMIDLTTDPLGLWVVPFVNSRGEVMGLMELTKDRHAEGAGGRTPAQQNADRETGFQLQHFADQVSLLLDFLGSVQSTRHNSFVEHRGFFSQVFDRWMLDMISVQTEAEAMTKRAAESLKASEASCRRRNLTDAHVQSTLRQLQVAVFDAQKGQERLSKSSAAHKPSEAVLEVFRLLPSTPPGRDPSQVEPIVAQLWKLVSYSITQASESATNADTDIGGRPLLSILQQAHRALHARTLSEKLFTETQRILKEEQAKLAEQQAEQKRIEEESAYQKRLDEFFAHGRRAVDADQALVRAAREKHEAKLQELENGVGADPSKEAAVPADEPSPVDNTAAVEHVDGGEIQSSQSDDQPAVAEADATSDTNHGNSEGDQEKTAPASTVDAADGSTSGHGETDLPTRGENVLAVTRGAVVQPVQAVDEYSSAKDEGATRTTQSSPSNGAAPDWPSTQGVVNSETALSVADGLAAVQPDAAADDGEGSVLSLADRADTCGSNGVGSGQPTD